MAIVEDNDDNWYVIEYLDIIHALLAENSELKEEIPKLRYALGRSEADKQELRDKINNR